MKLQSGIKERKRTHKRQTDRMFASEDLA